MRSGVKKKDFLISKKYNKPGTSPALILPTQNIYYQLYLLDIKLKLEVKEMKK